MMLHLRAQSWSSLGDDTFWCWAEREFPDAVPAGKHPVGPEDQVLHYGVLGAPPVAEAERTVALLWEQYPEMEREVAHLCHTTWARQIQQLHEAAAACGRRTVASTALLEDYVKHGNVDVLPLGVDTDLWAPVAGPAARNEIRDRFHVPHNAKVGFWGGHEHPMKGWDLLCHYARQHTNLWWVVAFKMKRDRLIHDLQGVTVAQVDQPELARLMQMCDFALFTSRLRPYAMLEWEAMSCNLPVVNVGHPYREFEPGNEPRKTVFDRGWDRHTAKTTWLEYLS